MAAGQAYRTSRVSGAGLAHGEFLLFASGGTASGTHDQLRFSVTDIQAEVGDLKQRGVRFEEYDFPGFDKATSTA